MSLLFADVVHWLHLAAAVVWVGGTFFYLAIVLPTLGNLDPQQARRMSVVVGMRFRVIAMAALVTSLVTGFVILKQLLPEGADHAAFFTSYQGHVLSVKLVLALAAIVNGLALGLWLSPRLIAALEARDEARTAALGRRMGFLTGLGFLLGLGILACVALLHAYA